MHRVGKSSGPISNLDPRYISSTRLVSSVFWRFGSDCAGVSSGVGEILALTFRAFSTLSPRFSFLLALLSDGAAVFDEDDGSETGMLV